MNHTQEPWKINPKFPPEILAGGGYIVGYTTDPDNKPWYDTQEETDAKRIVDCVNACVGIDNPAGIARVTSALRDLVVSCEYNDCGDIEGCESARELLRLLDSESSNDKTKTNVD